MPVVQIGCDAFETVQTTQPDGTVANRLVVEVANLDQLALYMKLMLIEMRVQSALIQEWFELPDSLEQLRSGEAGDL